MPGQRCDLHTHTYYSDGRAAPEEMLSAAAARGLHTLAITDHDTTRGAREALRCAPRYGIEVLPAIEFTSRWDANDAPPGQRDVDVLGYGVDWDEPLFRATEQAALADITARMAHACVLLTAQGHPLTLDDVFAQNPRYAGAMPLMQALQRLGRAADWQGASSLAEAPIAQAPICALSTAQVIAAIHAAGGVAVLAHPNLVPWKGGLLASEGLAFLVELGLDGLEVRHPRLDAAARAHFDALARQFGLLVTGGSDEHGWPKGFALLGSEDVKQDTVAALLARARAPLHR
jgi:3',5'-nucleoside bisphosphate phosphatase